MTRNELTIPLYANKPQRKVPGVKAIAVTMRMSEDRSVREYALFTTEGVRLGRTIYFHKPTRSIYGPAHYSENNCCRVGGNEVRFDNLAHAAEAIAEREGVTL